MIIKRYMVNNMNEAMTRIRYELGKDAIIISQRKIKKPGISGFFAKKMIEVTAAIENNDEIKNNKKSDSQSDLKNDFQSDMEAIKNVIKNKIENNISQDKVETLDKQQVNSNEEKLFKEMQEMKNMMNDMLNKTSKQKTSKSKIEVLLESYDCSQTVIDSISSTIEKMEDYLSDDEKLKTAIESMVTVEETQLEGTVVLVGPTGVGKTTTIAKLAGNLLLVKKKKVGLITIDTYRIGAVEQLRTYAEIMNIPFKVVLTIKEMEEAIKSMDNCDVILIDTTGRSSKNEMQISELRAFVEKASTDNINLVISSTTKTKDVEEILKGFEPLNYKNVIITKLDETSTYGSILNILHSSKKPLRLVTTGQNVPDDIKTLSKEDISKLVLGEDTIC